MSPPSCSIIVPTYNRCDLIPQTLDALLAQTDARAEIIVVDDGSTDDTQTILARYTPAIRIIRLHNGGELVARNIGLRAATGTLAAFCDSDDIWSPDCLATLAAQWEQTPDLLAAYCNFRILRDGTLSQDSKFDATPKEFWTGLRFTSPNGGVFDTSIAERLLRFQPFFPSCMMVERGKFLAAGGWDEGVSRIVGNDFATALRVAAHPPIGVVHKPLVAIRKHPGNYSADTEEMNLGDAKVLDYVLRTQPDLAPLGPQIRRSAAERRCAALDSAFSRRDFAAVREIYRLLPSGAAGRKQQAKRAIAALPAPLNQWIASLVSR